MIDSPFQADSNREKIWREMSATKFEKLSIIRDRIIKAHPDVTVSSLGSIFGQMLDMNVIEKKLDGTAIVYRRLKASDKIIGAVKKKKLATKDDSDHKKNYGKKSGRWRDDVVDFLRKRPRIRFTVAALRETLAIPKDEKSIYSLLATLVTQGILKSERVEGSRVYWFDSPFASDTTAPPLKPNMTNVVEPNLYGQQHPEAELIFDVQETLGDVPALDVGQMVNRLMAVDQQNRMYRQGFEAMLRIMEQMKFVEKE